MTDVTCSCLAERMAMATVHTGTHRVSHFACDAVIAELEMLRAALVGAEAFLATQEWHRLEPSGACACMTCARYDHEGHVRCALDRALASVRRALA